MNIHYYTQQYSARIKMIERVTRLLYDAAIVATSPLNYTLLIDVVSNFKRRLNYV